MTETENQVQQECVRALYKNWYTNLVGILIMCGCITYYFWGRIEQEQLASWLAAIAGTIIIRIILVSQFNKIANTNFTVPKWKWLYTLGVILFAIVFGSSVFILVDITSPNSAVFIAFVMTIAVSGGLAGLTIYLSTYYLYIFACLTPLIFFFYIGEGEEYLSYSAFLTLFLTVFLFYARNMNNILVTSIRQRYENRELLEKLTEQTRIAEQANVDKSRFLAATSHDLRQPLHSLGLFLSVLKEKLSTPEQMQVMGQAEKSQLILSEQLNTIIDITRIDAGELSVNKQAFQLRHFIDEITDEFSLTAKNAGLAIRTRVANDWTNTDKVLLARIVRNFISNAIQHCPGATLLIATRRRGNNIELLFIDNGPGIAEKDKENIFSEFYQLNNPERDRNKGLGLGLSIVKRLTNLLDMNFRFRSNEGKGSTFTITLPLTISSSTAGHTDMPGKSEPKPDIAGQFVIVVDDESENLEAMRALLTSWGCELLLADSEMALMEELNSAKYPAPDMLLIDYRLREEQTGFQVIEAVRKHFNKTIPSAIITGDTTLGLESKLTIEKCQILYKPLAIRDLQHLLDRENATQK